MACKEDKGRESYSHLGESSNWTWRGELEVGVSLQASTAGQVGTAQHGHLPGMG